MTCTKMQRSPHLLCMCKSIQARLCTKIVNLGYKKINNNIKNTPKYGVQHSHLSINRFNTKSKKKTMKKSRKVKSSYRERSAKSKALETALYQESIFFFLSSAGKVGVNLVAFSNFSPEAKISSSVQTPTASPAA